MFLILPLQTHCKSAQTIESEGCRCRPKRAAPVRNNSDVFQASYPDQRGRPRTIRLAKATDTPIKRHVKIKAAAHPYDPQWETYFEQRNAVQMKDNLRGYDKLLRVWHQQDGVCPPCGALITKETGWNLHHRVWLVDGGDESMANLILLHPTCHPPLHAQTAPQAALPCCTASSEEGV